MTTQKSIERLALFMGWEIRRSTTSGWGGAKKAVPFVEFQNANQLVLGVSWNPFTRLDDAMMVAEKIGGLGLEHVPGPGPNYWLASFVKKLIVGPAEAATPAEAIALAALAYLDATEKTK